MNKEQEQECKHSFRQIPTDDGDVMINCEKCGLIEEITQENQPTNRIREEWWKFVKNSFPEPIGDDEKILACSIDAGDALEFMLSKIDELLKSQRDSLVEKIKDMFLCNFTIYDKNRKIKEIESDILSLIKEE